MKRRKTVIIWSILFCWAIGISVPMSLMMAGHMISFETPDEIIGAHNAKDSNDDWSLNHVLSEDCDCSMSVADYLISRKSKNEIRENIVLLNGSKELGTKLIEAGYFVSIVEAEELCKKYGSFGVPYYQVITPGYDLYHSSGYFISQDRSQSRFDDLTALGKAQGNESLKEYSFYGCATNIDFLNSLNPFKL